MIDEIYYEQNLIVLDNFVFRKDTECVSKEIFFANRFSMDCFHIIRKK